MILMNPVAAYTSLASRIPPVRERMTLTLATLAMLCGSNLFNKKTLVVALAMYIPFVWVNLRAIASISMRPGWVSALAIYFGASYFWSIMPTVSFQFIWTQLAFILFAFIVSISGRWERIAASVYLAAVAHLFLVVLYCLLAPGASWSPSGLKAFYLQKNMLGVAVAIDALLIATVGPKKVVNFIALLVAVSVVLLTQSKTSIALLCVSLVLALFVSRLNREGELQRGEALVSGLDILKFGVWLGMAGLIVAIPFYHREISSYVVSNLDREALTGRGTLWILVFRSLGERSLLGLGPGVFWQADRQSEITQTSAYHMDSPWLQGMISADGSYVDLVAAIGFVGLSLYLFVLLDFARKVFAIVCLRYAVFAVPLAVFFVAHSINESTILYSTNAGWFCFLLCAHRTNLEYSTHGRRGMLSRVWRVN